jgi:pimeloyl-ACP methyl ester carboxylesterase
MIGKFTDQKAHDRYFAAYAAILRKWPVAAEELDIETRYGSTRVRRSGTAPGTPIVLLPGIMGTSLSWYPHIAELAAQHQVYAVDTLGEAGHSIQTRP